jgi:hypothetical protein
VLNSGKDAIRIRDIIGKNLSSILNFVQNAYKCSDFSESDAAISGYFKELLRQS